MGWYPAEESDDERAERLNVPVEHLHLTPSNPQAPSESQSMNTRASRPETSAAHFRKKPVVIEAVQWFKQGDHPAVIRAWRTPEGNTTDADLAAAFGPRFSEEYAAVPTLEDLMAVTPGDWIITGVQGEHYPCKPDIFGLTYEPASGEPQAETQGEVWDACIQNSLKRSISLLRSTKHIGDVIDADRLERLRAALGAGTEAAPTDRQIKDVWKSTPTQDDHTGMKFAVAFARAVLALAQPAQAGKPQDRADADELIAIARSIEALKQECGMDPESPRAIQNGRYMSIAYKVHALAARHATGGTAP